MKALGLQGIVALAVVIGAGWLFVGSRPLLTRSAAQSGQPTPRVAALTGMTGTASCSGRACHGGLGPTGSKGSEYTTWVLQPDPHTKAFAVLNNERSRRMVKNLRGLKDLEEVLPQADALCLSCHGPATLAAGPKVGAEDGFGCESCHGPAEQWLKPHTSWRNTSDADKRAKRFQPMDTMADRARVCADCHIGSGDRDVNHDLIAAGHPRLNFEFDTYYANLPPHWQTERDKDRAQAWLVGQTVCAEAALELLAYRADPQNNKPWPEFAEYDCFACHHDLRAKSGRQERGYNKRVPGTLPWSDWYYAVPAAVALPSIRDDLSALGMRLSEPLPDRAKVKQEAQMTAGKLKAWLSSAKELAATRPSRLITDDQRAFPKTNESITWDSAAQMALALQADYQDRKIDDPETAKALRELFRLLQFSRTGTFDSPVVFDGKAVLKQIQHVCARLEKVAPGR